VLAVAGAERVVDVDLAEPGQVGDEAIVELLLLGRQLLVGVLLGLVGHRLARVEADVLQQEHLARPEPGSHGRGLVPGHLGRSQQHGLVEELAEALGAGAEAALWVVSTIGAPEVAHQYQLSALLQHPPDGRQCRLDPPVVGDPPPLERYVEVHPHQHGAALQIQIGDGLGRHLVASFPGRFPSARRSFG